jgi:predicted AAA+ superfamily ATPase
MIERTLNLQIALARKSLFFLGPRQTGKTTFLRKTFPRADYFDLLDLETLRTLSNSPSLLNRFSGKSSHQQPIIIDEIQKMPELLNEVHKIIELHKNARFILTGSSSRKLRRSGVNLLGGRASEIHFHPLSLNELQGTHWSVSDVLTWGALPTVISSSDPKNELKDYVQTYLQREIKEEALVKKFLNFTRFLDFAAQTNTEQINFTSLGADAQLPPRTVQDYYSILEETLLGTLLLPFQTPKRKAIQTAKFYFFDLGIVNYLNRTLDERRGSPSYGKALDQMIFCEIQAFRSYNYVKDIRLNFWRTQTQVEVDFILEIENSIYAIEVKSTLHPRKKEYSGLKAFKEEVPHAKLVLVCLAKKSFVDEGIQILSLEDFVKNLWTSWNSL